MMIAQAGPECKTWAMIREERPLSLLIGFEQSLGAFQLAGCFPHISQPGRTFPAHSCI